LRVSFFVVSVGFSRLHDIFCLYYNLRGLFLSVVTVIPHFQCLTTSASIQIFFGDNRPPSWARTRSIMFEFIGAPPAVGGGLVLELRVITTSVTSRELDPFRFFFCLFILACDLYRSWRRTFYSVPCPQSARWRHVAISPSPSAQACPKKILCAPRKSQRKTT